MSISNIPKYVRGVEKYHPDMVETIMEVGVRGGTITQMALACGVLPSTLNAWRNPASPRFVPAVEVATEMGLAAAQSLYEQVGLAASQGLIKNHASGTFTFMMKNLFKHSYTDETTLKHAGAIEVSPSMTAIEAANAYKMLLADPSNGIAAPKGAAAPDALDDF